MKLSILRLATAALLVAAAPVPSARAANAAFQNFFFAACSAPTGGLAARCAETDDGLGDLSGDSESSLNPSQSLGAGNSARTAFTNRSIDARDQGYELRTQADGAGAAVRRGRFSLVLNGRTSAEEQDRRVDLDRERGHELDSRALQLGADYRLSERLVIGGWINWEDSELDFVRELPGTNFEPTGSAGRVEQDTLGVAGFLAAAFANGVFLDLAAGYNQSDLTTTRNGLFQESNRVIATTAVRTRGSSDGEELWATGTVGLSLTRNRWTIEPYLGLSLSQMDFDGYDERDLTGSGLALNVASQTVDSTLGIVGLRIAAAVSFAGGVLVPQLRVELNNEFDDDPTRSRVRFLEDSDNTTFTLDGEPRDDSTTLIGLGTSLVLPGGLSAFLEYQQLTGGQELDRWVVSGGLRREL